MNSDSFFKPTSCLLTYHNTLKGAITVPTPQNSDARAINIDFQPGMFRTSFINNTFQDLTHQSMPNLYQGTHQNQTDLNHMNLDERVGYPSEEEKRIVSQNNYDPSQFQYYNHFQAPARGQIIPFNHFNQQHQSFQIPYFQQQNSGFNFHSEPAQHTYNNFPIQIYQPIVQPKVVRKVLARKIEGKIWTNENDQFLLRVSKQCKCDWKKVSRKFRKKGQKLTPHFLKMRYKELTSAPVYRKRKFSHVEDLKLAKYFKQYGSDWNKIADFFQNRNAIMLKNRYYSHIKKKDLLSSLTEECERLEEEGRFVDDLSENEESSEEFEVLVDDNNKVVDMDQSSHPQAAASASQSQMVSEPSRSLIENGNGQRSTENNDCSDSQQGEIEILRARVKTLEELYRNAQNELTLLKINAQNPTQGDH